MSLSRADGFNLYFFDLFLILSIFIFGLICVFKRLFRFTFPLLIFVLFNLTLILISIFSVSIEAPTYELVKIFSYLIRVDLYFLFGYFVFIFLKEGYVNIGILKNDLVLNFWIVTFLNLLQLIFLPNLTELAIYGWDPHLGRLVGTFLDPNFLAFYLVTYFILNKYFLKNNLIMYVSIISVFLTLSRNGIITLLLVLLLTSKLNFKKTIYSILFIFILLLSIPNLNSRFLGFVNEDDSSYQRVVSWSEGYRVLLFSGFEGVGFNNYRNSNYLNNLLSKDSLSRNSSTSVDSSFFHILITGGFYSLILSLIFFISLLYRKKIIYPNLVLLVSLGFNSLFINSLFYPQISVMLFLTFFIYYVID